MRAVLVRQLLLPDRPGFGKSPACGPDDMVADSSWIANMLDEGTSLLGHSYGGAEVLLAAARRPKAVRSFILVELALHSLLPGSWVMARHAEARAALLNLAETLLAARTPAAYASAFAASLGSNADGQLSSNEAAAAIRDDLGHAAVLGCSLLRARSASSRDLRTAARTVKRAAIPILVVTGGWSPLFDAVGELAAELTGGHHVIVRSPDHFIQAANPVVFNATVQAFMKHGRGGA